MSSKASLAKILLIMRITVFLLIAAVLHVSAGTYAQKVNISARHISLEKTLGLIKHQTGYSFLCEQELLEHANDLTLSIKDATLPEALNILLSGRHLSFTIREQEKVVFIKAAPELAPAAALPPVAAPDTAKIPELRGRVLNDKGDPMDGASVTVKGTKLAATTNAKGEFVLKGVTGRVTIVVSFIGYVPRVYSTSGTETGMLGFVMVHNNSPLAAVHFTGYSSTTQRFSVGSVTTVTAEQIERQPISNPLLALEGQAAGVMVTPSNGAPGAPIKVQVREQNTLKSSSSSLTPFDQPLFIIDGVPFAPQNQNISQMASLGNGLSPFIGINPADIESMTILKDADATSIYGSKGAYGVVLITTKRAKAGKTKFDISASSGPEKITRTLQMMNTQQYLGVRREAFKNDNIVLNPYNTPQWADLFVFDTTKYTNWFKKSFGNTANNTAVNASLTGGTANFTMRISAGYIHQSFDFPGGFANDLFSFSNSIQHTSNDHRLRMDLRTSLSYNVNTNSGGPGVTQAMTLAPNFPDLLDAKGNLVWNYKGIPLDNGQLYASLKQPFRSQLYVNNNSLTVAYEIIPGLNARVLAGYSYTRNVETDKLPLSSLSPTNQNATSEFGDNVFQTVNIEPQIDYRHTIGRSVLAVTAGATYRVNTNMADQFTGQGYINDALLTSLSGASYLSGDNGTSITKYDAIFGLVNYIYDQKYIVNFTGRRDGSSNFGPGRQFGNFGSVGAGWIFSQESWFKNSLPVISFGKLYGNYGTNGSDASVAYQYLPLWGPAYSSPLFQGSVPFKPQNLFNPDYSWGVKKALTLGLSLGFLHDRLLVSGNWYRSRTGNQLETSPLASQTGFPNVLQNFPAVVQNAGWELTISSTNIQTKSFTWATSFNISANHNKLIAFPGLATSPFATYYTIGKSLNTSYGFKYKGVNDTTGVFEFYTAKGQVTPFPLGYSAAQGGDWIAMPNSDPKFFGGLTNNFSYKGFTLSVFFQFYKGENYNYLSSIYGHAIPGSNFNAPTVVLNHWKKPGDHTPLEMVSSGASDAYAAAQHFVNSTGAISDASYIRLKNLAVAYSLPASLLKKVHIQGCSFNIRTENLLTITGYKIGDPEQAGNLYSIPLQRTITGGLVLNF